MEQTGKGRSVAGNRTNSRREPGNPSSSTQMKPGEMNAVELAGRLAYTGRIGKARLEFVRNYIGVKIKIFQAMEKVQHQAARDQKQTMACTGDCHFCCAHYVGGSLQESEAIVYYLYQNDRALSRFLMQYPSWRSALQPNEKVFRDTGQAFEQMMTQGFKKEVADFQHEQSLAYLRQNLFCPFLWEGRCLIYPVRPKACASLFSFSGPESCDPLSPEEPEQFAVASGQPDPPYYYGGASHLFLGNIPVMVFELLKGGFVYLSSLPSLKNIAQEALEDPKARQILFQFQHLMKA